MSKLNSNNRRLVGDKKRKQRQQKRKNLNLLSTNVKREDKNKVSMNEKMRKWLELPYDVMPNNLKRTVSEDKYKQMRSMMGIGKKYTQEDINELEQKLEKIKDKAKAANSLDVLLLNSKIEKLTEEIKSAKESLKEHKKNNTPKAIRKRQRKERREFNQQLRLKEKAIAKEKAAEEEFQNAIKYESQSDYYKSIVTEEEHNEMLKLNKN